MELTREQILKEPAGRRLEAWVDELIFGEEIVYPNPNKPISVSGSLMTGPYRVGGVDLPPMPFRVVGTVEWPNLGAIPKCEPIEMYSSDFVSAFRALDKSDEFGYPYVEMHYDSITWEIRLISPDEYRPDIRAYSSLESPSLCVAICRAMLLAKLESRKSEA